MALIRFGDEAIGSYDDLLKVVRERVCQLQVTGEAIDHVGGLPQGLFTKLVAGRRQKVMGRMSFGTLLSVLSIRLVPYVDTEAEERLAPRLGKARFPHRWKTRPAHKPLSREEMKQVARDKDFKLPLPMLLSPQELAQLQCETQGFPQYDPAEAPSPVPIPEKPKPEAQSPVKAHRAAYNPDEPHPMPIRARPRFGRGHALAGRSQRSAAAC
jgi:hypothetical protein